MATVLEEEGSIFYFNSHKRLIATIMNSVPLVQDSPPSPTRSPCEWGVRLREENHFYLTSSIHLIKK